MSKIYVINAQGKKEPFSVKKVYRSARRAGASKELAFRIAKEVEKEAYPGIKTRKIFRRVLQLLKQEDKPAGIRFNLKEAIRKLGPTGFPFEKYIGEIFKAEGYNVSFNLHLSGKCGVLYEIDFIAWNQKRAYIGECKFHKNLGERVDLKVALMNYARFLDLKKSKYIQRFYGIEVYPLIVTNTKFTNQVIKYSNCVGQKLLGWRYPRGEGLERIIEENKLYPVTILPSFRKSLIDVFSSKKIMLVKDLCQYSSVQLSNMLNLPYKYTERLLEEARLVVERSLR